MKTIDADFNALTDEARVRLGTRGSRQSMASQGVRAGDWVWLTDGDLFAGARVVDDPVEGRVGEPAWETLADVSLLPDWPADRLFEEYRRRRDAPGSDPDDIRWQLAMLHRLAQLRSADGCVSLGPIHFDRALCLRALHQDRLALAELDPALRQDPDNSNYQWLWLDLLSRVDLDRALVEARQHANTPGVSAQVLAVCVQILGAFLEAQSEAAFRKEFPTLLEWAERFQAASERDEPPVSARVMVLLYVGLAKLRAGRSEDAVRDFDALLEMTDDSELKDAVRQLTRNPCYDDQARQLVQRYLNAPQAA